MPSRSKPKLTAAEAAALQLAAEAGALDLAAAAANSEEGADTLATLLAHELATGHRLMMRLAARADTFLDRAAAETQSLDARSPNENRAGPSAPLEAARLAGAAGRLMERYRLGLLALHRLREPGASESEQVVRLVWGGCPHNEDGSPDKGPADDGPGPGTGPGGGVPAAAPPAPALAQSARPSAAPLPPHPGGPRQRGRLRNGNPSGDFAAAPRCGARTRAGGCCRQPAMANGRCRLHGGKSTGPRTPEGLRRCRTARLRHGARSAELAALRRAAATSARRLRLLAAAAPARRAPGGRFPAGHGVHRPDFPPRPAFPFRSRFPLANENKKSTFIRIAPHSRL